MALMRSVSAASFSSSESPSYSEISAKVYLRTSKISIDFTAPTDPGASALPLSWSTQNIILFSRGNRVQYKNMSTGEDVGQLCKLRESWGDLRLIESGGEDFPNVVAVGTSKGYVQVWDLTSKKMTANWSTKGVASMQWNGPVLTVGGLKGTIKHYDTRIKETSKMKEQVKKVTRHQAKISRLAWNVDGNFLASGDESGTVYCWDSRQRIPLDVGEFVQRRKKMQHSGAITVSS
jgi:cell division cycle protein 20 (cofactor of APC complex)